MSEELLERISIDPAVAGGRATIRGHRIWVSLILGLLTDGMTIPAGAGRADHRRGGSEILAEYPGIDEVDVRACIAYGARLAAGQFVDLGPSAA